MAGVGIKDFSKSLIFGVGGKVLNGGSLKEGFHRGKVAVKLMKKLKAQGKSDKEIQKIVGRKVAMLSLKTNWGKFIGRIPKEDPLIPNTATQGLVTAGATLVGSKLGKRIARSTNSKIENEIISLKYDKREGKYKENKEKVKQLKNVMKRKERLGSMVGGLVGGLSTHHYQKYDNRRRVKNYLATRSALNSFKDKLSGRDARLKSRL